MLIVLAVSVRIPSCGGRQYVFGFMQYPADLTKKEKNQRLGCHSIQNKQTNNVYISSSDIRSYLSVGFTKSTISKGNVGNMTKGQKIAHIRVDPRVPVDS